MVKIINKMFLAGAVIALASACSSDETIGEPKGITDDNAIVLDVQEVASPISRAQHTGSMDFTQLKVTGFGVYGYKGEYNNASSLPTLFKVGEGVGANKHVTFISGDTDPTTLLTHPGSWDYTNATIANLKEWETGEKYTFFAYAPWMSSGEGTKGTDAGINSIKTTDTAGAPTIDYTVATDPAQSVDLLWGVRTAYTSGGTAKTAGLPWIDITRGETTSAVLFTFYHALCAVGLHAQVMVDQQNRLTDLDDESNLDSGGTIGRPTGCKVTLREITITPAGKTDPVTTPVPFHQSATLNLNNTTAHQPLWTAHSGTISSLVLDDGATAGHGTIDATLRDPNPDDYEVPNPGNYDVMTDTRYDTEVPGVTESANSQTVISGDKLYMLIPQVAQDYTVTVGYFITYQTSTGNYHREYHTGTATIHDLKLVAGVKYYLNLVFGLTTFKLTVDAVDWDESTTPVTIATETGTSAGHSLAKPSDGEF